MAKLNPTAVVFIAWCAMVGFAIGGHWLIGLIVGLSLSLFSDARR